MTVEVETRRRRWRRHHLDVPIRVIVHGAEKTSVFVGRGNELSEGGLALTAGVELKTGDAAEIEFTPPYSGGPDSWGGAEPGGISLWHGVCGRWRAGKRTGGPLKTMLTVLSSSSAHSETVER
jgi:hypothetical protein